MSIFTLSLNYHSVRVIHQSDLQNVLVKKVNPTSGHQGFFFTISRVSKVEETKFFEQDLL